MLLDIDASRPLGRRKSVSRRHLDKERSIRNNSSNLFCKVTPLELKRFA